MNKDNAKIKELHTLIQAMSKAEKRHFNLIAKQFVSERDTILLRLFDVFSKQAVDSVGLLTSVKTATNLPETSDKEWLKNTLPFHINALYRLVMKALRDFPRDMVQIKLLEMRANIIVLTDKGLWDLALKEIKQAQKQAKLYSNNLFLLELMLFERRILRNLTLKNAQQTITKIDTLAQIHLTDISKELNMITLYEKAFISIRDKKNTSPSINELEQQVDTIFDESTVENESLETFWHYCLFKSFVVTQRRNFVKSNLYLKKIIDYFEKPEYKNMLKQDFIYQERYLNLLINLLNNKIRLEDLSDFDKYLEEICLIEQITSSPRIRAFAVHANYYLQTVRWDLEKKDNKILELAPKAAIELEKYASSMYQDRRFSIFYNIGTAFFRAGKYTEALPWVVQITNLKTSDMLRNAQVLAKLLLTIIFYENYKLGKFKKLELMKWTTTLLRKLRREKANEAKIALVVAISRLIQKSKESSKIFEELNSVISQEDDLTEIKMWIADKQI